MFRRLAFNSRYLSKPPWDSGISPPELIQFIRTHPPGKAIDLGCGTGTNIIALAQAGWQATGVDFAPRAIRIAKKKLQREHVQAHLYIGDVTQLDPNSGPFDLALDIGCFHSLTQAGRSDYLTQLERLLSPGGFWLLYGFLKLGTPQSGPGITEVEISLVSARFSLRSRQNGLEKSKHPSAWFLFQKP